MIFTGAKPTWGELGLLKFSKDGKKHKLSIIKQASHRWKDIAGRLSIDPNRATTVGLNFRENSEDCLRTLFVEDFINKKPANDYSQDWNGIIELLDDIGEEALSKKVKECLGHRSTALVRDHDSILAATRKHLN